MPAAVGKVADDQIGPASSVAGSGTDQRKAPLRARPDAREVGDSLLVNTFCSASATTETIRRRTASVRDSADAPIMGIDYNNSYLCLMK